MSDTIDVLDLKRKIKENTAENELRNNPRYKKRYFKTSTQYFNFLDKHPEYKIDKVEPKPGSILIIYSKRVGRPKNNTERHAPNFEGFRPLSMKK